MSVNQAFEFPQELRELTEKNVEQARATYGQFMDAMMQGAGIWMAAMPSNDLTFEVQDRPRTCYALCKAEYRRLFRFG